MTRNMEEAAGAPVDLEEAEKTASEDVVAQREEALAKQLNEMRSRKKRLVDPLQFEMSIQAEDLSGVRVGDVAAERKANLGASKVRHFPR